MDFRKNLIESTNQKGRRGWRAVTGSFALHAMLIAGVVFASNQPTHKVDAEEKPIAAFLTQGAAPPPPPPPPPAPAGGAVETPKAETPRPKVQPVQQSSFTPPREIPKDVPKVDPTPDAEPIIDLTPDPSPVEPSAGDVGSSSAPVVESGVPGGVEGGVVGGQVGGVVGGEVGGVVGGEIGGVKGGVVGGTVGGTVGGSGTGTEGTGSGGVEAPVEKAPEPPSGPLRVGGNVKAPVVTNRVNPEYTDIARKARVTGVVVVEAIIDKNGNVDSVKVVKDLPMGLSEQAAAAVRRWKFKPGTLNGEPVATIFNLTVNFTMSN